MTFTEKVIEASSVSYSSAQRGTRLKECVTAMVANVPGMEIVSVASDTATLYDVTLSYRGATIQLYNASGNNYWYCIINGCSCGNLYLGNGLDFSAPAFVSIKLGSNGHVCVKATAFDSGVDFCLAFLPVTCEMTDGTLKNVLLAWGGLQSGVKVQIPSFAPVTLDKYVLCDPDTGGYHAVAATNAAGTFANYKGKAEVTPFAITSAYGEIASVTYNGYPLYKIQIAQGQSLFSYGAPGFMQVTIGGATFLEIGSAVFARLS